MRGHRFALDQSLFAAQPLNNRRFLSVESQCGEWPPAPSSSCADLFNRPDPRPRSNALPQTGLLVEAIQLDAAEVEAGNDPDHFTLVNDRQMAAAS